MSMMNESLSQSPSPPTAESNVLILDDRVSNLDPRSETVRIPACRGAAFRLNAGERLVVTDPEGEQVSDLFAVDAADVRHVISSGRTLDYANRIYLKEGDSLYSNRSREMFELIEDTSGGHDFLLTPCSQEMYEKLYGIDEPHPSCFDNLSRNMGQFGVNPDAISTTLNIFMNVRPDSETGELTIGVPTAKAGEYAVFEARMDLIVGLTACAAELTNNGKCTPIDFRIEPRRNIARDWILFGSRDMICHGSGIEAGDPR